MADERATKAMRSATETRIPVSIVYHCVAHYRDAVFRELIKTGRSEGIEYTIAADTVSSVASIRVVDHERLTREVGVRWIALRNLWFPAHFLWQRGVLAHIARDRPAAVIFLGDFHMASTWIGAMLARLLGTRVFMWTHGYLRRERGPKGLVRLLFYRLANGLLVYGNRAKALLVERGYSAERVRVIFNSLDHEAQVSIRGKLQGASRSELRKDLLGVSDEKVFAFAGRLEAFKGLDLLLLAFQRFTERDPRARLVCIGDGPIRKDLERQAEQLGIAEKVVFWGACYDEELMGRLFHSADVSVSPGPVGLLAIHSLVYGTPVILSDDLDHHGPEFEVVTEGKTGAFFTAGSVDDLASKMAAVAERMTKPGVCEECFHAVDAHYTPSHQSFVINRAVLEWCGR
jgi:glycosyltransferase involved in cell wall biosynthesis